MANETQFPGMEKENWTERRGPHQTLLSSQEETRIGFLFLPSLQQHAILALTIMTKII